MHAHSNSSSFRNPSKTDLPAHQVQIFFVAEMAMDFLSWEHEAINGAREVDQHC
jgi:hypothetical protein